MDLKLFNKTALVTGSTAGIGLAIATALAREQAMVIVNGRTQQRVDEAIKEIQKQVLGAKLKGFAADLGTHQGIEHLTAALPQVDILVNNLGIFEPKPFQEISDKDWFGFSR